MCVMDVECYIYIPEYESRRVRIPKQIFRVRQGMWARLTDGQGCILARDTSAESAAPSLVTDFRTKKPRACAHVACSRCRADCGPDLFVCACARF